MTIQQFNSNGGLVISYSNGSGYMYNEYPIPTGFHYDYYGMYRPPAPVAGCTTDTNHNPEYELGLDVAMSADYTKTVWVELSRTFVDILTHATGALFRIDIGQLGLHGAARPSLAAGRVLFLATNASGNNGIYVVNENGTGLQCVAGSSAGLPAIGPGAISPDGTWAVFSAILTANNTRQLYRAQIGSGTFYRITPQSPYTYNADYPESDMPSISPDGNWITYVGGVLSSIDRWNPATWVRFGIFKMAAAGGPASPITLAQPGAGNKIDNPSWWPWNDGVVYDYYEPGNVNNGFWSTDGLGNYVKHNSAPHGWSANACYPS